MKVFLGCSAKETISEDYLLLSYRVADYLAKRNYDLVFGTYSKSMMGECYKAFKDNLRQVYACVSEPFLSDLDELDNCIAYESKDTFNRTKSLYDLSDLLIILPGGSGTYAELFMMISEKIFTDNKKTLILFNYNHFYDELIKFYNRKVLDGFISSRFEEIINIINTEEELYNYIGGITWKE